MRLNYHTPRTDRPTLLVVAEGVGREAGFCGRICSGFSLPALVGLASLDAHLASRSYLSARSSYKTFFVNCQTSLDAISFLINVFTQFSNRLFRFFSRRYFKGLCHSEKPKHKKMPTCIGSGTLMITFHWLLRLRGYRLHVWTATMICM